MTVLLNQTGNPITREERIKINENWDRIIAGMTTLQHEINMLAGTDEVKDMLEAINTALVRIAQAQAKADEALIKADQAINSANTAGANANNAADRANQEADNAFNKALEAQKATEDALDAVNSVNKALIDFNQLKQNVIEATNNANQATQDAITTIQNANNAVNQVQKDVADAIVNLNTELNNGLTENETKVNDMIADNNQKITELIAQVNTDVSDSLNRLNQTIQDSNNSTTINNQKVIDAITNMETIINSSLTIQEQKIDILIVNANTSIDNTIQRSNEATATNNQKIDDIITDANGKIDTVVVNANDAALEARTASETIKGWTTAEVWNIGKQYIRNNVVTFNGSTWQSLTTNTNSQPSESNTDWILLAQRGVDGTGSVVSVNGIMPDTNGDVKLDLPKGTVTSVNDIQPDSSGNITIELNEGTVKKVNGKSPNDDGEVILTPSEIDTYNKSEIDAKVTQLNDKDNLLEFMQNFHWSSNIHAHGGDTGLDLSQAVGDESLPINRVVKRFDKLGKRTITSTLRESQVGSGVFDVLEVVTETFVSVGDIKTELMSYKLTYKDGAVIKVVPQ